MRKTLRVAAIAVGVATLFLGNSPARAADTTVVVTADDLGSGWYPADTRAPGTGTFENGPATPPLGTGSFELSTPGPTGTAKVQLFTDAYDGVALTDITHLSYATYRDPASTGFIAGVAALNLRVDTNNDGVPNSYFVYEPYQDQGNAAVQTGVWQNWDAISGGSAKWWVNNGTPTTCGQNNPCTWTNLLLTYPGATIQEGINCGPGGVVTPCPGSLGVNQGSNNPGIISNVDALSVGVNGSTTTYNFELIRDANGDGIADTPPPTSKDQCKKDGWKSFNNPSFKNQGDCVSFVATGGKNPGKG
jgi:hypothetical protein